MQIGIQYWKVATIVVAISLSACGGGGGGNEGGGANQTPAPSFTLGTSRVTLLAAVNQAPPEEVVVPVNLTAVPDSATLYGRIRISAAEDFIENAFFVYEPGLKLKLSVNHPSTLAPATYTAQAQLQLCLESSCNAPISGSPATFDITYTVTRPTGALAPRVSMANDVLSLEALPIGIFPKSVSTLIRFENVVRHPVTTITYTGGVESAGESSLTTGSTPFNIRMRAPNAVGVGRHNEVVTVRVCLDSACVNELEGSPLTVTVNYNVTNRLALEGGHTLELVDIYYSEAVWDPHSHKFYFIEPAQSYIDPDSLGSYNPTTGARTSLSLGGRAEALALSSNGQYLYVGVRSNGEIRRFRLPSLAPDISIPLGNAPGTTGRLFARQIAVMPGAPATIAVTTGSIETSASESALVAVFDNAVRRNALVGPATPSSPDTLLEALCWGNSPNQLYGARMEYWPGQPHPRSAMFEMAVSSNGVAIAEITPDITHGSHVGNRIHCVQNRVYTDGGFVFNPIDNSVTSRYQRLLDSPWALAFDVQGNRIFGGGRDDQGTTLQFIRFYEFGTFNELHTLMFPEEVASIFSDFSRWGSNGLAFGLPGYSPTFRRVSRGMFLMTGPMIGP